jgi:hypothetical protein
MFLLKLKLFFNANITVNKLSTRHVHTLVPEDTHVHTLVPEDTYWATYYQRLINITEIVRVEPYNLRMGEQCQGHFYSRMEDNMRTVLNYPVIDKMKVNYKNIFEEFEKPVPIGSENENYPVIVTGASSQHYHKSLAMIKSVKEKMLPHYTEMKLIFFDLGLKPRQHEWLKEFCKCEIRKFPFHEYPPFVSKLHNYVWKPIIIYIMLKKYNFVMWADASINLNGNKNATDIFFRKTKETGILVTRLGGDSRSFYHTKADTFKFLNESTCLFELHQTEATYMTIWKTSFTWKYIIQPWLACALTENCMSHKNPPAVLRCWGRRKTSFHWCHRFDQSVLSIILQRLFDVNYDIIALNRLPRIGRIEREQWFVIS